MLVDAYPRGVNETDNDGLTPLDIAMKWEHPKDIMKSLLIFKPIEYRKLYYMVQYGKSLGSLLNAAESVFGFSRRSSYVFTDTEYDNDTAENTPENFDASIGKDEIIEKSNNISAKRLHQTSESPTAAAESLVLERFDSDSSIHSIMES